MKAIVIVLALLLVILHPLGAALALGAVAAGWAGLGWLFLRGLRALQPPAWRRAA